MKVLTIISLVTMLSTTALMSEEISLPVISRPAVLQEGTQTALTKEQVAELLPWAKDSKMFLNDLMENIQGLTVADKIDRMVEGISSVVGESSSKNSELLMRYALNRGLVLNEILSKQMNDDIVGTQDAKLRVLRSSILLAIKYYDTDMATLANKSAAPFVVFGLDYFTFLNELNKSIFDASAQYAIQRTALEWLQWDLYRDLNNASYAPQIVKINNSLKVFPTKQLTDAQSIAYIRQMKSVASQLRVDETLAKVELEKKLALAKTEAEKKEIIRRQQEEKLRADYIKQYGNNSAPQPPAPVVTSTVGKGDLVVYGSTVRTVEFTSDNGQVILQEDRSYNRTVTSLGSVSKLYSSTRNYSAGNKVLYGSTVRVIEYVAANGMLVLLEDSSYNRTFVSSSSVSRVTSGYGNFVAGDKVLYSNTIRVIEFCSESGAIALKEDSSYNRTFTNASNLSKVR